MRRSPPPLADGTVHVWSTDLDRPADTVARCRALLSPDETSRASQFHFERDAARYIVGRAALRQLLAAYLGRPDPRDVAFDYGPHGKPALKHGDPSGRELHFNLAHSGGFALFAFALARDVGVDVEQHHHLPDLHAVMRSCFAAGEREGISSLSSSAEQHDAFFRCWTRKEAVLKALGSGLAKPLDSFEVTFREENPRLLSMASEAGASAEWQFLHLDPAPGFVGAVAWRGPELKAECLRYEP